MLLTSDLDYDLPRDRIAIRPAEPRDSARMLVVSRSDEKVLEHARVRDLTQYLRAGDLVILNTTHVLPAWLEGRRVGTGGRVEGLFLSAGTPAPGGGARWVALLRAGHLKAGAVVEFVHGSDSVRATLIGRVADEPGAWELELEGVVSGALRTTLERIGATPIPPYIRRARREAHIDVDDREDRAQYQTVYADPGTVGAHGGSVAAPTAGLHFTPELLQALGAAGVRRADTILHVGPGTFRPVETRHVEEHAMHAEWCRVPPVTVGAIGAVRAAMPPGRVFAVGTTSARSIETFAGMTRAPAGREGGDVGEEWFESRLLITPGYRWRLIDGMLTNFHLPRSTLMAMIGSLFPGGVGRLKEIYAVAIREGYRFYSYGDAMLIVP